jgi:hypothetical protein
MTTSTFLGYGWHNARKYLLAILAVAAMRAGLVRVLSDLAYPVTRLVFKSINFIIRRGFPDHLVLNETFGPPWQYHAKMLAEGIVIFVVGMFFGLWANSSAERQKVA